MVLIGTVGRAVGWHSVLASLRLALQKDPFKFCIKECVTSHMNYVCLT